MAPEEEATKRAMRIDGRELNTEYLARPKHNPGSAFQFACESLRRNVSQSKRNGRSFSRNPNFEESIAC